MKRRDCLRGLLATAATATAIGHSGPLGAEIHGDDDRRLWEAWKARHLDPAGRVIDRLQQDASHSEGQGYGMVLATYFRDHESFARMHAWTEEHLAVRDDALLAWRWLPLDVPRVPDRNNASDGDLFFAWALLRAAQRFQDGGYFERARQIVEDLGRQCVVESPEDQEARLFLPAAHGFAREDGVIVNPSYYMPRAMRELSAATGLPALARCADDGERLLTRIAMDGLVPDWVLVGGDGWRITQEMPGDAGYEAMRVLLFFMWSGLLRHPALMQAARAYRRSVIPGEAAPTVLSRESGDALERSPDPGYRALAALVVCAAEQTIGAPVPPFTAEQPYYPATLQLFSMIAARETMPGCVPI